MSASWWNDDSISSFSCAPAPATRRGSQGAFHHLRGRAAGPAPPASSSSSQGDRSALPSSAVPFQPGRKGRRRRPCRQLWKTRQRRPALDCGQLRLPSSPPRKTRRDHLHPQRRPRHHRHAHRPAWSLPWAASLYTNKLPGRRCKTWRKERLRSGVSFHPCRSPFYTARVVGGS